MTVMLQKCTFGKYLKWPWPLNAWPSKPNQFMTRLKGILCWVWVKSFDWFRIYHVYRIPFSHLWLTLTFEKWASQCHWFHLHLLAIMTSFTKISAFIYEIWRRLDARTQTHAWTYRQDNNIIVPTSTVGRGITSSSAMAERPRKLGDFKKVWVNGATDNDSHKDSHKSLHCSWQTRIIW